MYLKLVKINVMNNDDVKRAEEVVVEAAVTGNSGGSDGIEGKQEQ